jgi:hypothetical protein
VSHPETSAPAGSELAEQEAEAEDGVMERVEQARRRMASEQGDADAWRQEALEKVEALRAGQPTWTSKLKPCEDCQAVSANYGLPTSDPKTPVPKRWCSACGAAPGAVSSNGCRVPASGRSWGARGPKAGEGRGGASPRGGPPRTISGPGAEAPRKMPQDALDRQVQPPRLALPASTRPASPRQPACSVGS